jgi:pSer/pThr/pTyr-binding forkhead associated (FHA) protein
MLVDRLGGWLTEASRSDHVAMELEYSGTTYNASLESLTLIGAAASFYQEIANKLRAIFRAEDTPALQVSDRFARLPGLTEMLKARVGGEVFVLEPGATARGALARCRKSVDDASGVSLIRQLPWDQTAIEIEQHTAERTDASTSTPTHLLHGHTAYEIGNLALVLGSQEGEDTRQIMLASDMPGISRRHCSLLRKNGQCVLEDHSRYGTFLNGHRIDGSSVLQVGDVLRVGSPGFEFQLIMTDDNCG